MTSVLQQVPPGMILVVGAFAIPLLRGVAQKSYMLLLPVLTLAMIWGTPLGTHWSFELLGYELAPIHATSVGRLFATVFGIMAFTGAWFALGHATVLELVAAFIYAGSAIGVTFSGDLISLFIFWELMAVGSTIVIWAARSKESYRASIRYLLLHLLGGVLLMIGIAARVLDTQTTSFGTMNLDDWYSWLIFIGFLINAGAPPLSSWIADAYPEASPSGTVFLSAFTTKTAVFALWVGFPGTTLLIPIGVYMIFYGIIFALLENDMRRILSYSIVNQVGFMVTGIGIGTELSLNGTAAHAFAHIIYKALLLMSAGSVLLATGRRKCSSLGGLFQSMPLTTICGTIGALAISAFPYTSGFISKSMINSAAAHEHIMWVWFCLVAASAGVFLHAGIKFPWFVFFQKDSGLRPPDPSWNQKGPMLFYAFLCIGIGVFPKPLYDILPFAVHYEPYTPVHLVGQFQLLLFAGLAFFVLLPLMKRTETLTLDWDWFYRRVAPRMVSNLAVVVDKIEQSMSEQGGNAISGVFSRLNSWFGSTGVMARSWESRSMILWTLALLGGYLLYFYMRR